MDRWGKSANKYINYINININTFNCIESDVILDWFYYFIYFFLIESSYKRPGYYINLFMVWGVRCFLFLTARRFIYLDFVGRVSRRRFDLKLEIVLTLRSRQTMKRDLYHWILWKILKKKPLINFFRQLSLRDRLNFWRVFP